MKVLFSFLCSIHSIFLQIPPIRSRHGWQRTSSCSAGCRSSSWRLSSSSSGTARTRRPALTTQTTRSPPSTTTWTKKLNCYTFTKKKFGSQNGLAFFVLVARNNCFSITEWWLKFSTSPSSARKKPLSLSSRTRPTKKCSGNRERWSGLNLIHPHFIAITLKS